MPKVAKELSALEVKRLTHGTVKGANKNTSRKVGEPCTAFHAVGGVPGLLLQVTPSGAKSWILRVKVGNVRRDMGLGGYPAVTLEAARDRAREARDLISRGIDPVAQKRANKAALLASQAKSLTFDQAADKVHAIKSKEFKNAKHGDQWINTIRTYASPHIGKLQVSDIELPHILKVLEPIWESKTETATRLRQRIEATLAWARVHGYRKGENPARWKGHLDAILSKPSKIKNVEHHKALPYEDMGEFMKKLRAADGLGARAVEFTILTATRSAEVRGAKWSEIDFNKAVWIIPAGRMKASKEHHVPLSPQAIELLKGLPRMEGSDYIFTSKRAAGLSENTLMETMRRLGRGDLTVHGFRSTFRDWAAERTNYPREVCEHALAHRLKDKAEAAYQRKDMFPKRVHLMNDWAKYCDSPTAKGAVIPINQGNTAA
jgi:integrase